MLNKSILILFTVLALSQRPKSIHPRIIEFRVYTHYPFNLLTWTVPKAVDDKFFEIEKSYDSIHFKKIGISSFSGIYWNFKTYIYSDSDTSNRPKYYRLTLVNEENEEIIINEKIVKSNIYSKHENSSLAR